MSNYLVFDNIDTRNLSNIYVFPNKIDDTPMRVYDVREIAGRNGSLYIDQGRFENVEHKYSIVATTKAAGSDFINKLSSKIGYHRLSDSFNSDEFYMATFANGVEVKIPLSRDKNVFEVTFIRKPQRFLTSGETAVDVSNGGTLTNPTLFESSPMLQLKGYGTIAFNGYTINVENEVMGEILLANSETFSSNSRKVLFSKLAYETGDTITLEESTIEWSMSTKSGYYFWDTPLTPTDSNSSFKSSASYNGIRKIRALTTKKPLTFTAGTNQTITNTVTVSIPIGQTYETRSNVSVTCTQQVIYTANASSTQSSIEVKYALSFSPTGRLDYSFYGASSTTGDIWVNSTQSLLGNPTYIDCDTGEAYKITSGVYVSLNPKITIGAKLPKLASGSNTVTYSNTFTSVKFEPRWWKV